MRWWVVACLSLGGCVSVETSNPVLNVGAAVAAAAVSRARGDCVATCTAGTVCDTDTGRCALPCDDQCRDNEVCTAENVCAPLLDWTPSSTVASTPPRI